MAEDSIEVNTSPLEDLTGRTIGPYLLIRRLGRGGMADVYLAEQSSLRRHVALKILKPSMATNATYVKRFHQEALAAANLVQSNIVQIYEVGDAEGVHYIAQEYVRGQNLRQYLNRHGAIDPVLAVSVIRQVAAALQKAAEQNVIHRDIKPENIMLTPGGEVKVADFGLARINDPQRSAELTQIGITMGTPLYMSPEQVQGLAVDSRTDIYSLGITAYHMLSGDPPFRGDSPLSIAFQQVNQTPPPLQVTRPDVPEELCQIVDQMIAKAPENRFQSPQELIRAIRKIHVDFDHWDALLEKLAVDGAPLEGETIQSKFAVTRHLQSVMTGGRRPWWRRPATWLAAAIVAVSGFTVGAIVAMQTPPRDVFATVATQASVPRKATASEQYLYAFFHPELGDAGWLAVGEYFGGSENSTANDNSQNNDLMYVRMADERLGEYYLQKQWFDAAEQVYRRLANVESYEVRMQTIGHMGLAIVYDLYGQTEMVKDHLFEVAIRIESNPPAAVNYLNEFMQQHYDRLVESYAIGLSLPGENGAGPNATR